MIAPLPSPSIRTRLTKMVPIFNEHGYKVRFFGWERTAGESLNTGANDSHIEETPILKGGGYSTKKALAMYPVWMLTVFWCVLRLGKGQLIFCLGWETAFPARLAAAFTGAQVIFDDADRFSLVLNLPSLVRRLVQRLERWTSFQCELHVVPGFARYDWKHQNMQLLRNTPLLRDFEIARVNVPERPSADFVLYANGWIGETRGAPVFLELLERAEKSGLNIHMVIAGRIEGPSADSLIRHNLVTYVGQVQQNEALSWYQATDLLLTFYDPIVPINRKAESNKWGDAVHFDTPFVVNSEVETAKNYIAKGAAFSVPYADAKKLFDLISDLVGSPEKQLNAIRQISTFKASLPLFDNSLENILRKIES